MKQIIPLVFLFSIWITSCTPESSNEEAKETINLDLSAVSYASKTKTNSLHLGFRTLAGDELSIETSDTISGTYTFVSYANALEAKQAVARIQNSKEDYKSTSGILELVIKDSLISGQFSIAMQSDNGTQKEIENQEFKNLKLEDYVSDQNPIEFLEQEISSARYHLNENLKALVRSQLVYNTYYTHQLDVGFPEIRNNTVKPSSKTLLDFWNKHFQVIRYVNTLKASLHTYYDDDAYQMNQKIAEVLCYRAYVYSSLVNWFGNSPLLLEFPLAPSDRYPIFHNTEEIQAQISKDLEFAVQNLPETKEENTEGLTQDFAKFLWAKIALSQKKYSKVITLLASNGFDTNSLDWAYKVNFNGDQKLVGFFSEIEEVPLANNSQLMLLLAEAYAQNNQLTQAIEVLNFLRKNSGLDEVNTVNTQEFHQLLLAQLKQQPYGVFRFFMLKSMGAAKQELGIEDYQLILPIPQSELDYNINAKQNPNY